MTTNWYLDTYSSKITSIEEISTFDITINRVIQRIKKIFIVILYADCNIKRDLSDIHITIATSTHTETIEPTRSTDPKYGDNYFISVDVDPLISMYEPACIRVHGTNPYINKYTIYTIIVFENKIEMKDGNLVKFFEL